MLARLSTSVLGTRLLPEPSLEERPSCTGPALSKKSILPAHDIGRDWRSGNWAAAQAELIRRKSYV